MLKSTNLISVVYALSSYSTEAAAAVQADGTEAKTVTIPLERKQMQNPVTRTQKLVTDYHHKCLSEAYENLWLGPKAEADSEHADFDII